MTINQKKAIKHLENTNLTMPLKGIDVIGTGDCQFYIWNQILRNNLIEVDNGIFKLEKFDQTNFVLQTELIFTVPIGKK